MSMWQREEKMKAITFSYDDGVVQDTRLIELLNKYGLKCTFNLNSELLGRPDLLVRNGLRINHYKIHPQDVREHYAGHEVAAHTLTHPYLPELPPEEVIRQVEQDRLNLSRLVGYEVVGMAYPGGGVNYDDRVVELIRNHTGIRYCRTTVPTEHFSLQKDLFRLQPNTSHLEWERLFRMAREFLAMDATSPQLFFIWGHAYEMDYDSGYWGKLETFFRLVSGRQDIFYGTNREVLLREDSSRVFP